VGERVFKHLARIAVHFPHPGYPGRIIQFTYYHVTKLLERDATDPLITDKEWQAPSRYLAAVSAALQHQETYDLGISHPVDQNHHILHQRMGARTATGRFINCPDSTQEDDEIWILAGLSRPAVLRKTLQVERNMVCYQYVGQAYVYGIMMGEAMVDSPTLTSILLV